MKLYKEIKGEVLTNVTDEIRYISTITGVIQQDDFINLSGFIGYLQNLKKAEVTSRLTIPQKFGLPNTYNKNMVTLEISY